VDQKKRPIGVTLLSLIAFLVSPGLIALFILSTQSYFGPSKRSDLPDLHSEPGPFVIALTLLVFFHLGFLILAFLSCVAGRDLWLLRPRGRSLTLISMILWLLQSAVLFYAVPTESLRDRSFAGGVFLLCLFSIVYLFLPRVRASFETRPTSLS